MSELSVSIPVKAPSGFALAFLATYVSDHAGGDTASGQCDLHLRLPLQRLANLTLEREVHVHVRYEPTPGGNATVSIGWHPAGATSLLPSFEGQLTAQPIDEHHCTLTIAGRYEPPLGPAGALFDAIVGTRIAHSTIEGLLGEFRDAVEVDYAKRMTRYGD